ncbi:lysophospholipid acyltransferase family protein [bacterium]|nr:lysophospholipid acyltransferase family protein [bacterium]
MSGGMAPLRRARYLLEYAIVRGLAALVAPLPRPLVWKLGGRLGRLACRLLPSRRRLAHANVARAFPQLSPQQVAAVVSRSFENFARTALDILWSMSRGPDQIARWVRIGPDVLAATQAVAAGGRGGILALAHFGNWEIVGLAWGWLVPAPVSVIAKPLHNPCLDRWLNHYRRRSGNRVIPTGGSAREVLMHLREGRLVAMVMDQRTPERYGGVAADFFGHPAMTTKAPASFALSLGVPIVVLACVADEAGCYHVRAAGPLSFQPSGDRQRDVLSLTQTLNRLLEEEIRRAPEYYFWMHDRWGMKDSPPASPPPPGPRPPSVP